MNMKMYKSVKTISNLYSFFPINDFNLPTALFALARARRFLFSTRESLAAAGAGAGLLSTLSTPATPSLVPRPVSVVSVAYIWGVGGIRYLDI